MRRLPEMLQLLAAYEALRSERGTIAHLILPVLEHCDWPVDDPARVARELPIHAPRRTGDNFDVALRVGRGEASLAAVIECKSVGSGEFREGMRPNAGVLVQHEGVWMQPFNSGGSPNRDGLAQLRRYCENAGPAVDRRRTIPVFTNGKTWIGFRMEAFLKNLDAPVAGDARLFGPIAIDDPEFPNVIQMHLGRATLEGRFCDD